MPPGPSLPTSSRFGGGVQYLFFCQWGRLQGYAHTAGIEIMGDLPIYVAEDSVEVWAHPEQFQLDENLRPTEVAGCPPDGFSATGQLWGNPLFAWDRMREDGYRWWIGRIAHQFKFYDILRIDHFRGFDSYYAIPAGNTTAAGGQWREGPGIGFFRAVEAELGPRRIVAEDLGFLTPSVHRLLAESGYPGMKVLQFAFDSRDGGAEAYVPFVYPTNSVAYVGTHDNDTALGWLKTAPARGRDGGAGVSGLNTQEGEGWGLMRGVLASTSDLAVVLMQDLLELGSEGAHQHALYARWQLDVARTARLCNAGARRQAAPQARALPAPPTASVRRPAPSGGNAAGSAPQRCAPVQPGWDVCATGSGRCAPALVSTRGGKLCMDAYQSRRAVPSEISTCVFSLRG